MNICQERRKYKNKKYVMKFPPLEAINDKEILDQYIKETWYTIRLKTGFFPKAVIPKKKEYIEGVNLKEFIKKDLFILMILSI